MNLESYLLILSAAFTASIAHCIGMCGGIVLAFNAKKLSHAKILQIISNILYFLGRMCGYIIIGIIFSIISKSLSFGTTSQGIVFIVLGILLFFVAFTTTFMPKFSNIIPTNYRWYKKFFFYCFHSSNVSSSFVIGILNGFLPCHLVYMFAIKAADSMNVWHAILTMIVFALGTFLPLFLVGVFSANLMNSKFRWICLRISFLIMIYFSCISVYKGSMMLRGDTMHHNHSMDMSDMPHTMHDSEDLPAHIHMHHD